MFVFETTDYTQFKVVSITGKNVIEICASVIEFHNNSDKKSNKESLVKFITGDGSLLCEISENGLIYAISGDSGNETENQVINEESQKFWEMNHDDIISIEFANPIHNGDAIWDEDYKDEEEDDSEYDESDKSEDSDSDEDCETNNNIVKTKLL